MSDSLRITGLATGLDVDALVKQMISTDNLKVDKAKGDKQVIEWKQELYRDIMTDLNTFKSTYFDVLKGDTNMLSSRNYSSFDVTSSDTTNSILSLSATGSNVLEGSYSVRVEKLAKGAYIEGSKLAGGTTYATKLSDLGIGADTLNITYSGAAEPVSITIDPNATIGDLKNLVSKQSSGKLNLNFSELTGKITLNTTDMGSGITLSLNDGTSSSTLSKLGINGATNEGQNALVYIKQPGASTETLVSDKKTNSFTIDGVNYKLSSADSTKTTTFSLTENITNSFDKIKGFVDKYNEIIDKISTKITEKKQYTYLPLTDAQKKDMKEDEIKTWETKAKQGLLKGDSSLQTMLYSLRSSFFSSVEGANISLKEVGLSTSSDTSQGGKIIIDEIKLKEALKTNKEGVEKLFSKKSEDFPSYSAALSSTEKVARASQEGIFQRINDILQDNLRTIRDSDGKKGILLEKAGIKGDFTEFTNLLTKSINDKTTLISALTRKMSEREEKYYAQFSKLEVAMQKLNDQSSWMSQQFSSGS